MSIFVCDNIYIFVVTSGNSFGLHPVQEDLVNNPLSMGPVDPAYKSNIFPGLSGLGPLNVGGYGQQQQQQQQQQLQQQQQQQPRQPPNTMLQLQAERRKRRLEYQQNINTSTWHT